MDIIKIDIVRLKSVGLSIQEYITLLFLYVTKTKDKQYDNFVKSFGTVSINQMKRLEELNFIKIPDYNNPSNYELRDATNSLFEGDKDLFLNWLLTFPIKTPSGRYLSPLGEDTKAASVLRNKWKLNFGTDTILMQKAIDTLQAEINWRKKTGKMEYLHNAETWLHQGDWEKYEYLLGTYENNNQKQNEDFI